MTFNDWVNTSAIMMLCVVHAERPRRVILRPMGVSVTFFITDYYSCKKYLRKQPTHVSKNCFCRFEATQLTNLDVEVVRHLNHMFVTPFDVCTSDRILSVY